MAIGLTVGAFIVFLMKLEPGKGSDTVKREKVEQAQQQKASKIAEANKTPPSPTQPVKPKYDFYTLLPESEVIVPPEAVPEKTLPTLFHGISIHPSSQQYASAPGSWAQLCVRESELLLSVLCSALGTVSLW